jgi:hypothetical protein
MQSATDTVTPSLLAYLFADRFIMRGEINIHVPCSGGAVVDEFDLSELVPSIALWTLSNQGFIDMEIYNPPRDPTAFEVVWHRLKKLLPSERRKHHHTGALYVGKPRIRVTRKPGAGGPTPPPSIERDLLQLTMTESAQDVREIIIRWVGYGTPTPHHDVIQRAENVAINHGLIVRQPPDGGGGFVKRFEHWLQGAFGATLAPDCGKIQALGSAADQLAGEWGSFSSLHGDMTRLLERECERGISACRSSNR